MIADTMDHLRISDFQDLQRTKGSSILAVRGAGDSLEGMLERLEIPHSRGTAEQILRGEDLHLSQHMAVLIGCGTGTLPTKQAQRFRQYVADGGYLLVTDMGAPQIIRTAFPGYYDPGNGTFTKCKVSIAVARGATGHPLLRGINHPLTPTHPSIDAKWTIADGAPDFSFDARRVTTLIEADSLATKNRSGTVAATFTYPNEDPIRKMSPTLQNPETSNMERGGRVLCILSHLQDQTAEDAFALDNLVINFLLEARDRKLMREEAKKAAPQQPPPGKSK